MAFLIFFLFPKKILNFSESKYLNTYLHIIILRKFDKKNYRREKLNMIFAKKNIEIFDEGDFF